MQKALIILGLVILLIGIAWPWLGSIPPGRLPGDIIIERENFRFCLPITTMLVASAVISLIIWLLRPQATISTLSWLRVDNRTNEARPPAGMSCDTPDNR